MIMEVVCNCNVLVVTNRIKGAEGEDREWTMQRLGPLKITTDLPIQNPRIPINIRSHDNVGKGLPLSSTWWAHLEVW